MNDRADEIERASHRCEMLAVLDVADASRITNGAGGSTLHPHLEEL